MVLQDIGAARFFLVDNNNIVAVPDRLPYKGSPDTAQAHNDDVHAYRLPPSPLK
jgi:hypothetical protein